MRWLASLASGIVNVFRRGRLDRDMQDELAFHLEQRQQDLERRGLTPAEARRQARVDFGGVQGIAERTRDTWTFRWLADLRQDVRHAVRMFAASPGFTAIAVLSIAIGIGANASIFSVADALVFRPLGVRDPNAVVSVSIEPPEQVSGTGQISYPNYLDLRARSRAFDGLVAYELATFSFAASREAVPDMRMGMAVSDNFFSAMGIEPAAGRAFAPGEAVVAGRDAVLVLGHDFWSGALGADATVVGRDVWLNGVAMRVIGIAPARFAGMDQYLRPALFIPATMLERLSRGTDHALTDRRANAFDMHGRLARGTSLGRARNEAAAVWHGLVEQYPDANRHLDIAVRTEFEARLRNSREDAVMMMMLLALTALVLAIACANVANLLLGRARARSREIAIRLALGVSRVRLLRQLLTESALLATTGCVAGVALASAAIRVLSDIHVPSDLPIVIEPRLDERVLAFSIAAAGCSALLFGLVPAWRSLGTNVVPALKQAGGRTSGPRMIGRGVLVGAQVALSMVLLISAGLMLEGFHRMLALNPGFRTDRLLMMTLDTGLAGTSPPETRVFYRDFIDRVRREPGVASATMTSAVPLDPTADGENVVPEGYELRPGQRSVGTGAAVVDDRYFSTMQIGIVRGRAFSEADRAGTQPVIIVNEEFASRYWPGQDAIGRRVRLAADGSPWMTVVGLTNTGKYVFLGESPQTYVYLPVAQHDRSRLSLIVQSAGGDPASLVAPLRQLLRDVKPDQPVYNVRPLPVFYEQRTLAIPKRLFQVVTTMGIAGLVLALIGLYGLVGYSVACRTREIGIRIALGASRGRVLGMVLRQGLALSIAGVAVGGVASAVVARVLVAGMSGLAAPNREAYVIVPLLLIALTLLASYLPARRASRIDPVQAVKHE